MSETPVPRADSRGRRCVAGGCSNTKIEGISLHYFPFDRPAVLRRWIQFVQQYRRDWKGPSKTSTLCSVHFTEDAYPAKYKIMESMGVTVSRKDLNKDAIPTLQTKVDPCTTPALALGKRKAHPTTPLTSTPKKPRRAYLRRESKRIVLEFEQARRESKSDTLTEAGRDRCNPQGVEGTQTEQQRSDDIPKQPGSDNTPEQQRSINTPTIELDEERCTIVVEMVAKETRTVGCQRSLTKPMRKSHYTQTKWKTSDKVVQAGNPVKTRDVGIACELLPAPPLRRLGEPETPVLHEECADTTFLYWYG
ncbi:THAP domain-containing protein 10-like isoform X3 [Saccostrea cucullata]|uniref:THAP domain-containing protein 10-like isoform X3 n=1 Tax=Saccostrea cuccullata TaxID=36930 RepID=UPI002ED26D20